MNARLQAFARLTLKEGLSLLSDEEQMFFKRMYSYNNLELPIDKVVDNMPEGKLDWAMQQVENTIIKNEKKKRLTIPTPQV
jgi:hypothetical protein